MLNKIERQTKKDDIAEFCHLLIKINLKTKGTWRIGQIVANAVRTIDGRKECDPFYIHNSDLITGIEKIYEQVKNN